MGSRDITCTLTGTCRAGIIRHFGQLVDSVCYYLAPMSAQRITPVPYVPLDCVEATKSLRRGCALCRAMLSYFERILNHMPAVVILIAGLRRGHTVMSATEKPLKGPTEMMPFIHQRPAKARSKSTHKV